MIYLYRTDLHTLKLENETIVLERADLTGKLSQLKADNIEKEMQLNSEFQKLKQDFRDKDDQLQLKTLEIGHLNSKFQVNTKFENLPL